MSRNLDDYMRQSDDDSADGGEDIVQLIINNADDGGMGSGRDAPIEVASDDGDAMVVDQSDAIDHSAPETKKSGRKGPKTKGKRTTRRR